MKNRRLIITLLISCILLCCTAQAVTLRITVVDEETYDAVSGASVYVDGDYVGSTSSSGTYSYVHSEDDDLYLKIVRTGYRNWMGYVDYDATRARVEMIREDEILTFELYDAGTLQPISGAVVDVEGDDYSDSEVTGRDGSAEFSVRSGESYDVEISASGYYDLSKTVEMENSARVVQYWLFSNDLLAVQVQDSETSEPIEGAEVFVDNARAGATDADGRLQLHLERAERYSIKVTAADYQTYLENRYFETDDVLLQVDLVKSAYPVSITAFNEAKNPIEGAEVYLNGMFQGKTNEYGRLVFSDLHGGTYQIVVKAPGYGDWSETYLITGAGEDIVAQLGYDRASVTIRAKDPDNNPVAGAAVVIDGQVIGTTDGLGCLNTPLVTNKVYAVTAACEGYRNISVNAEIPLGTTEFTVPLVMEQDFDIWMLAAGVGVVAALLLAVVMIVRRRRAARNRGKSRGRDSL
ncbi:PEGA domain-containing protein [Methanoculleus sp.]|uniref:PEGA domain-containing protein n=1 Tax=Methanoculleus sp. TaxID=90427 RepID=UPI001BD324DB|nr:PEGA domain-containing protein [Methanoculleus sp.]